MAEQSFPVIEKPMTDEQWKSVTLGIGDGILDEGGNPYRVELSNQTDQATVQLDTLTGVNHAIIRGFYHRMDAPVSLDVPAVSSKTTYVVALRYDPTDSTTPVRLGVWKGIDRSNGKYYLVLATIERSPNQLLSNATLKSYRTKITPSIQVDYEANLPDPSTVLWGTKAHCFRSNKTLRASWGKWVHIGGQRVPIWGVPGWKIYTATNGILARPTSDGWDCSLVGNIVRDDASYTVGSNNVVGTLIPPEWRPETPQWNPGLYRTTPISVSLNASGQLLVEGLNGAKLTIEKGYSISFSFHWFTSVDPTTTM